MMMVAIFVFSLSGGGWHLRLVAFLVVFFLKRERERACARAHAHAAQKREAEKGTRFLILLCFFGRRRRRRQKTCFS
jgi:hypothetical protein